MVSTRKSSRAGQVASNAWLGADGGCIFADAPHAGTSAAAIVHQVSMHRNMLPLPVTRSSRVSSRASIGFTTIVQNNSSPARSFALLTRVRRINRRPDRPQRCLQTGKRCFTNSGRFRSDPSINWRAILSGSVENDPERNIAKLAVKRLPPLPRIDRNPSPHQFVDDGY